MERESEKRMHPDIAIDAKKLNIHARNALEEDSAFWMDQAKKFIVDQVAKKPNTNKAKNVILFLGDGFSLATQALTRLQLGGEEKAL